jgi:hypothetical protein
MIRLPPAVVAGLLLLLAAPAAAAAEAITTLDALVARVGACIRSAAGARRIPATEVTLIVAFTRTGDILGKPAIAYESPHASDADRLAWREVLMTGLIACAPLPLGDGLGNAVAGRPLRIKFDGRHLTSTDNQERTPWLLPKTL